MFLILTYSEYDSQSSQKAWEVWYPYKKRGFATRQAAEDQIVREGNTGERFFIVEVGKAVIPSRTTAVILADELEDGE